MEAVLGFLETPEQTLVSRGQLWRTLGNEGSGFMEGGAFPSLKGSGVECQLGASQAHGMDATSRVQPEV